LEKEKNMKSYSKEYPSTIKRMGNRVKLRKNITEIQIETEQGTETQYEYDEAEVSLIPRANEEQYINDNFDALFALGEKQMMQSEVDKAQRYLDSTDWIFAKCYELGLDPQTQYPDVITKRGEARETIRNWRL
jgi:hypothetical protein